MLPDAATVETLLVDLVQAHGADLCLDHRKVERLLGEELTHRPAAAVVVHVAVREGVAADLSRGAGSPVPPMPYGRFVRRLFDRAGLGLSEATWAVDAWAGALDRATPDGTPSIRGAPVMRKVDANAATRPRGAIVELRGHRKLVAALGFRVDGKRIATVSTDRTARIWDPATGRLLRTLYGGHREWVRAVAWSPNGKQLATGGDDGSVCLWDAETGEKIHRFVGGAELLRGVAFTPDGRVLAGAGLDGVVHLWELESLQRLPPLGPLDGGISRLAFEPLGRWLAIGVPGAVEAWDVHTRTRLQRFAVQGDRPAVAAGPESRLIIGDDAGARCIDVDSGRELMRYVGHQGAVRGVAIHPNGKTVVTGGVDRSVRIWHTSGGLETWRFETDARITSVATDGQGQIGMAFADGHAKVAQASRTKSR